MFQPFGAKKFENHTVLSENEGIRILGTFLGQITKIKLFFR